MKISKVRLTCCITGQNLVINYFAVLKVNSCFFLKSLLKIHTVLIHSENNFMAVGK